jgi:glutathione S-transferase
MLLEHAHLTDGFALFVPTASMPAMGNIYITVEEAISRPGLRMVVVGQVPSPWSEAAKGIFHVKQIPWAGVRLAYDSQALKDWTGQRNAPVVVYDDESPRSGWAEILLLAERLAPSPALLPKDPADRALAFGLAHEIMGQQGLGWSRRLQLVEAGLLGRGGFDPKVAAYIGKKYGYSPQAGAAATSRVVELLTMLAARLKAQHAAGSPYYVGEGLSAVDIYSASALALLRPLPQEVCPMHAGTRAAFEFSEPATEAALDEVLLRHRDMMYQRHLPLPLSL